MAYVKANMENPQRVSDVLYGEKEIRGSQDREPSGYGLSSGSCCVGKEGGGLRAPPPPFNTPTCDNDNTQFSHVTHSVKSAKNPRKILKYDLVCIILGRIRLS